MNSSERIRVRTSLRIDRLELADCRSEPIQADAVETIGGKGAASHSRVNELARRSVINRSTSELSGISAIEECVSVILKTKPSGAA